MLESIIAYLSDGVPFLGAVVLLAMAYGRTVSWAASALAVRTALAEVWTRALPWWVAVFGPATVLVGLGAWLGL